MQYLKTQNNEFLNLEIRRLFSEIEPKALVSVLKCPLRMFK